MATPAFGGTNGVAALDIGQVGSARRAANQAYAVINVLEGDDDAGQTIHRVPQQNVVFRDVMGFAGRRVTWRATLKVDTDARLATIEAELNAKRHGGMSGFPDPSQLRETRLTNMYDRIISERAVLTAWQFTDRTRRVTSSGTFTVLVPIRIDFLCLG